MNYPRAPITEAVLELRFAQPLDRDTVERASSVVAGEYFYNEEEQQVSVSMDVPGKPPSIKTEWEGRKLSSLDRADVAIFRRSAFVCSRLAPYLGWKEFRSATNKGWAALKRYHSGPIEVARIGLRYVNRIDVPARQEEIINVEDYLKFVPQSPQLFTEPMLGYLVQAQRAVGADDLIFNLLSSTVPSPLINTVSFSLDLDVYLEMNIPKRDEDLWSLIERMRGQKNLIFEACITDRARELFK
ncbi:uncharacterized protein (TIGR04255 family) [Bradyrhizobium sp. LB7.2]